MTAFAPTAIFKALYQEFMHRVSEGRAIAFDDSNDVLLRSGFTAVIENSINRFFRDSYADNAQSAVDIHKSNLAAFREQWQDIHSTNTCLCCLRRRPQYCLPCRHCICENCVVVFGVNCDEDPCTFEIRRCFLCHQTIPEPIIVRTRPPTAGVGVLCIDGGGTRGIVPLTMMKLIQDRLGSVPLQRCVTVSFGVSVGKLQHAGG